MENMLTIDHTLLIQLANFLVTLVVLNYLLIKPIREQIAKRDALTAEYADSIEQFTSAASQKLADYESSLAEARSRASLARESLKAEGAAAEQEVILAAQQKAQAFLRSSREQTAKEAQAAMNSLLSQVKGFAETAMNKIIG